MHFPGRFADQLVADQLHKISLSFLVDELVLRRGGVAPNIAFGLGVLGLEPLLVGAVGSDFGDYQSWLERHNVDCSAVHVSQIAHTSRFVCTTDDDMCQIASFYAGAMSEARDIELGPIADRFGGLDLVLISANDPDAMVRHTQECRDRGIPFVADPSQQLARMDGPAVRTLVEGAEYLFTNEYERGLMEQKTGWSAEEILDRVKYQVTTLGSQGVQIQGRAIETITVKVAPERKKVEPTGVGDGFRAGFFAGVSWGLSMERAAQIGSVMATLVIETTGTQEYQMDPDDLLERLAAAYGESAAQEVKPHLPAVAVS